MLIDAVSTPNLEKFILVKKKGDEAKTSWIIRKGGSNFF
jgi:hypothetical protein